MRLEMPSSAQGDEGLRMSLPDGVAIGSPLKGDHPDARPANQRAPVPGTSTRRFDANALATIDRLVLTALYGTCAFLAICAAIWLRSVWGEPNWPVGRLWLVLFPAAIVLLRVRVDHRFTQVRLRAVLHFIGLLINATIALLAIEGMLWVAGLKPLPAAMLATALAVHVALCLLARSLHYLVTRHWKRNLRIVVVGADEQGVAMAQHLHTTATNVEVVGFVDDRRSRIDPSRLPAPFMGTPADFLRRGLAVDGIVIALPNNAGERVDTLAATLRAGLINIYLAPETAVLRRSMFRRQPGGLETMVLLGMDRLPLQGRIIKRAFDIVFSALALICFLPFGLLIALLIKLESPGPVIFRQGRYGLGNRMFSVYKFRSMRFETAGSREIRLTEHGDSRVTRIGNFLRRSSLDEFPQFLNVLMGQMSVVGPRPHPPGVRAGDQIYEDVVADFMERYKVRPGITGWAQVNGLRGNTFTEQHLTQRFAYDIQYIRNWSPELDIWIVIKTVLGGFGGKNAF